MTYLRVQWKHQHSDEPVLLYSELDADRFEVRKVELFADGSCGYASAEVTSGSSRLGLAAIPDLGEIAKDPQFEPVEISREEFEDVWSRRTAR